MGLSLVASTGKSSGSVQLTPGQELTKQSVYDLLVRQAPPRLILVAGYSGSGKSQVLSQLREELKGRDDINIMVDDPHTLSELRVAASDHRIVVSPIQPFRLFQLGDLDNDQPEIIFHKGFLQNELRDRLHLFDPKLAKELVDSREAQFILDEVVRIGGGTFWFAYNAIKQLEEVGGSLPNGVGVRIHQSLRETLVSTDQIGITREKLRSLFLNLQPINLARLPIEFEQLANDMALCGIDPEPRLHMLRGLTRHYHLSSERAAYYDRVIRSNMPEPRVSIGVLGEDDQIRRAFSKIEVFVNHGLLSARFVRKLPCTLVTSASDGRQMKEDADYDFTSEALLSGSIKSWLSRRVDAGRGALCLQLNDHYPSRDFIFAGVAIENILETSGLQYEMI